MIKKLTVVSLVLALALTIGCSQDEISPTQPQSTQYSWDNPWLPAGRVYVLNGSLGSTFQTWNDSVHVVITPGLHTYFSSSSFGGSSTGFYLSFNQPIDTLYLTAIAVNCYPMDSLANYLSVRDVIDTHPLPLSSDAFLFDPPVYFLEQVSQRLGLAILGDVVATQEFPVGVTLPFVITIPLAKTVTKVLVTSYRGQGGNNNPFPQFSADFNY